MGQNTSRLGLYLPGGGSTGLITPDEPADIDKINDNMTKLDADAGAYVCTSSTRPATPYNGKIIFETDTRKTMIYKSATTSWEPVDSQGKIVANAAARDALFASPVQGTKVFRTDIGVTETYYAAWNASTNPGGKTPAGWYIAERSTGLVPIVPPTVAVSGGSATANSLGVVSFSAVTSISLNNVFSAGYKNYRVLFGVTSNIATNAIYMRFRAGGTDTSTSLYRYAGWLVRQTGATLSWASGGTSAFDLTRTNAVLTDTFSLVSMDIGQPQEAAFTKIGYNASADDGTTYLSLNVNGALVNSTQYDGFTIYPGSGGSVMSGYIQVFGYNS